MATRVASLYAEIGADTSGLKKGLQEAKAGLAGAAKGADSAGTSIKGMITKVGAAVGVLAAVGAAAKKAFDLGAEGTQLEYAAGKFDRLTDAIGGTSDALLIDLRKATKGTLSDARLMAGAGDLMALGLANSYDEVIRLSRVVGGLGMDMNQLVLTLTNQTTMRFDALGVSVDGFDAKVAKLKKTGMSANDAFKEAFLQQAEAQLEKIGDKADTGAGAIARMEASSENLANSFKLRLAPAAVAVANTLNDILTNGQPAKDAIDGQARAVGNLTDSYDVYVKKLAKVAKEQGYTVQILDGKIQILNSSGMEVSGTFDVMSRTEHTLERSLVSASSAAEEQAAIMGGLEAPTRDAASATYDIAAAEQEAYRNARNWKSSLGETVSLLDRLNTMDLNFGDKIKTQLDAMKWDELGGDVIQQAAGRINLAMERGVANGGISEEEGKAALAGLFAASEALEAEVLGTDFSEVATNISNDIHVPLETAASLATAAIDAIKAGELEKYVYTIELKYIKSGYSGGLPEEGKAAGGPVKQGMPYLVGERGPEMFIPSTYGNIVPNNQLSGASGGGAIVGGGDTYNSFVVYQLPGEDAGMLAGRLFAMSARQARRNSAGLGYAGA